jgi:thiazole synthase
MPLGSPIGTIKDLRQSIFSKLLSNNQSSCNYRRRIGAPSDAAKAMELGADAVLSAAIAVAGNPKLMAELLGSSYCW